MLGGVAAGIAETYGLDVTLVRVLWVIAGVVWIGVPAYIIAWIALEPGDGSGERVGRSRDTGMLLGLVLVAIGVIIASNRILPHGFRFDHFGAPLLLIGGGSAILFLRRRGDDEDALDDLGDDDAENRADESVAIETPNPEPHTAPAYPYAAEAAPGAPAEQSAVPPSAWTQTAQWPAQPSARSRRRASRIERRARRPRSFLTPLTLSVLLIGAGIASLLQATGALDVNLTVVLAIGTCIVGAALVTAAFAGRAHSLIVVGLMLLAATAVSNSLDVPLRGGIGTRHYHPLTLAELQSRYRLGIGEIQLDLRDLPLAGRTETVDAQVGVGHLSVSVPSSVRVEVQAHAGAGSTMLFGQQDGGWPQDEQRAVVGTGPGVLRLDLRVGAGQVEVRRFLPDGSETIMRGN
jgi:phage shock protein PspC (stress-responsive transcriptional regulator)/predicted membrane protein